MAYWYQSGHNWYWNPNPDTKPSNLYGYSLEAITDPGQKPPEYVAPPPPPVPADVEIPTLSLEGGWPPPLTGDLPTGGGKGDNLAPPTDPPFHILPSSLREAEATIMAPITTAVNGWNDLKAHVDKVKDWVFYRPEHEVEGQPHVPPTANQEAMVSNLDNALLLGADAVRIAGMLVAHINAAGQIVVHADKESTFPTG